MKDSEFEAGVQEAMKLLRSNALQKASLPSEARSVSDDEFEAGVQEAMQLLRAQQGRNKQPTKKLNAMDKAMQVVRGVPSGVGGMADLVTSPGKMLAPIIGKELHKSLGKVSSLPLNKPLEAHEYPSYHEELTKGFDKLYGKDLSPTDTWGKVRQGTGEFLSFPVPGAGGAVVKAAKMGTAPLAKHLAKELGSAAAASTMVHATPRISNPDTVGGVVEDIVKAGVGSASIPSLTGAISRIFQKAPSLSDAEKRVANYLQKTLGEEPTENVIKNIKKAPKFNSIEYEPTTAEVVNTPLFSQLQRLRQGAPGSGFPERTGAQNEAITEAATNLSLDKATSDKIKHVLKDELSIRKERRHIETEPLYEEVRKDETKINPVNILSFLKENKILKGKKRRELEMVRKLIKPSAKLSSKEMAEIRKYKAEKESILSSKYSESAKEKLLAKLEKPERNYPTVADLDEARQNINDRIADLSKSEQNNRVRLLKKAINALDKDLEKAVTHREATIRYARLSKPVSEIIEHPNLKQLLKSRSNNVISKVFDDASYDNVYTLKNVLKERPKDWKAFQDASVDYMMKFISNAGAEGKGHTLSYAKLNKFVKKHEKALREVFTRDQIRFFEELRRALTGRNIVKTLAKEEESPTYGKLIAGTHLNEGLGKKVLEKLTYIPHATPIPKVGPFIGEMLRSHLAKYAKSQEADVMAVFDKVLKDPEYAHRLLNHKFKNQYEFNRAMNNLAKHTAKRSLPVLVTRDKSKQE